MLNGSQVVPVSPVIQTRPLASVIEPADASENEIARKSAREWTSTRLHVSPASSLRATQPPWPETTICFLEVKATPVICRPLQGVAEDHVEPPSFVMITTPFDPAAATFSLSNAAARIRCSVVPAFCSDHDPPLSVVFTTVPCVPTAQPTSPANASP